MKAQGTGAVSKAGAPGLLRQRVMAAVDVPALVLWYALGAVLVHVVPGVFRLGGPPWTLPIADQVQIWYWTIAFLLGAFGLTLRRVMRGGVSLPWLVLLAAWPWAVSYVALAVHDGVAHSRMIALISAGLGALVLVTPLVMGKRSARYVPHALAVLVLAAALVKDVGDATVAPAQTPASASRVLTTALTPLSAHYERNIVPDPGVPGGALARFGRELLLVTGAAQWYSVGWDSTEEHLRVTPLQLPTLMSRDVVGLEGGYAPFMRVTGLAADVRGDSSSLLVVHEVWDTTAHCVAHQVSTIRLHLKQAAEASWRPVYRTQPCVKPDRGFDPYDSGSRATVLRDGSLLLTVGDYGMTSTADSALAQQPDGDYGKTLLIHTDGRRSLYTSGHRNPGGITTDRDGNVWVVEHGPRGGDEINLLRRGANYGWPLTTYGTEYGSFRWRFPPTSNKTFVEPAFVFVPSVGISNVIEIEGRQFEQWSGDLLAGTLVAEQLLHIRRIGSRLVYAEPIPVEIAVRDLVEAENGRIVIWNDDGNMVWLSPATDLVAGTVAYEPCIRCHNNIEDNGSPYGPPIAGIVGRPVAASPDFKFSDALKRAGGSWTEERLDAFLRSPSEFAPGTTMVFPGIPDSATRRAVIEFLRQAPKVNWGR